MKHWILPTVALAAAGIASSPALAGKADDTLNWATDRDIAVIDPYYNNTRELVVMGHLGWDALLFRNLDTGEYEPLLATGIEWIDNVTLEVGLRDDVVFHDGSSFGSEDVVYTINHIVNEDNGVLTIKNVNWMKSAEALGPHKVRINLDQPFPAAFAYLSNAVFIMPEGHYDSAPDGADGRRTSARYRRSAPAPTNSSRSRPANM